MGWTHQTTQCQLSSLAFALMTDFLLPPTLKSIKIYHVILVYFILFQCFFFANLFRTNCPAGGLIHNNKSNNKNKILFKN